jgi:hypothetical protein
MAHEGVASCRRWGSGQNKTNSMTISDLTGHNAVEPEATLVVVVKVLNGASDP